MAAAARQAEISKSPRCSSLSDCTKDTSLSAATMAAAGNRPTSVFACIGSLSFTFVGWRDGRLLL
jgi:hypothetical protein